MSNIESLLDSFNKSLYSYHKFKTEISTLLTKLPTLNNTAGLVLLDNIYKIISSKYNPPSQKFYALYSVLKLCESQNEAFINDLTQKEELVTKIFQISQTDMDKSETSFTRGTNFFSPKPSRGQAKAGINCVKLSIELICYLGQIWGVPDRRNPRSLFIFMLNSLKKKMTIPKDMWFISKDYIIPENKELYCWNFNKKTPEVASEGPKFVLKDQEDNLESKDQARIDPEKEAEVEVEAEAEAEAEAKPKPEGEQSYLSGSEEPEKQVTVEEGPSSKKPKLLELGLQDSKARLKQSAKVASEPTKLEEKESEKPKSPVLAANFHSQNIVVTSPSKDIRDTENKKKSLDSLTNTPAYTGISATLKDESSVGEPHSKEQKENISPKKSLFQQSGSTELTKKVSWVFEDYSPLSSEDEEDPEHGLVGKTMKRDVNYHPTQPFGTASSNKIHEGEENHDYNKEKKPRLLGRAHTFNVTPDVNRPSDFDFKAREKMNAGGTEVRTIPGLKEISHFMHNKFIGPKDIEDRVSSNFVTSSSKDKKCAKLERELEAIQNSIRKSMQLTPITPKNYRPPFARAQTMMTGTSVSETNPVSNDRDANKDTSDSREKFQGRFPNVNYLPFDSAKGLNTKLTTLGESGGVKDARRKLNFNSGVKSEANIPSSTSKIGPVSQFEERLSKWKEGVIEKTSSSNQGNILQRIEKKKSEPKMKEIEAEDDSDKENIFKVPTPDASAEKEYPKRVRSGPQNIGNEYRRGKGISEPTGQQSSLREKPKSEKEVTVGRKLRLY